MTSFVKSYLDNLRISSQLVQIIRLIGECKGKQDLFKLQAHKKLENLRQVAFIQSVESSNRIEGVAASKSRLAKIVEEKTTPRNRSESEIAGYRDVLATIHNNAVSMPFTENVVLQLHRDLMKYGTGQGGIWKTTQNEIEETKADGTKFVRFVPTPPHLTATAMQNLHHSFNSLIKSGNYEPLILIALYVLDFLCIHPFLDGNGRMSRLLTVQALYQQGYEIACYVSLEKIIEQTKESYYETLYEASQGWHKSEHSTKRWIEYFLGTILATYKELESRVSVLSSNHGSKADIVIAAVDRMLVPFTMAEISAACPSVGRDWIQGKSIKIKISLYLHKH